MDSVKKQYEAAGQGHVFEHWGSLSGGEQNRFLEQLKGVDPVIVGDAFRRSMENHRAGQAGRDFTTLSPAQIKVLTNAPEEWNKTGLKLVSEGKVAACVLAGGQGTRLGLDQPKGTLDINLPSHYSLFQMQALRVQRVQILACIQTHQMGVIPFLVMTSAATHNDTVNYFRSKNFFGLKEENVYFFQQGALPAFTPEGKIMLADKGELCMAPDGNAGVYPALRKSGLLEKLESRGVEYLNIFSVDNALARPVDPTHLGQMVADNLDCSAKSVMREDGEKVGVFGKGNGAAGVLEYSEIGEAMGQQRNGDGSYAFGEANIAVHLYTTKFLKSIVTEHAESLSGKYHIAEKNIKTQMGEQKGVKLEGFIFDAFRFAPSFGVARVTRETEFAPIKNPDGNPYSPTTARLAIFALHKSWLEAAGVTVEQDEEVDPEGRCEICPLVSFDGEGLEELKGEKMKMPVELQSEV